MKKPTPKWDAIKWVSANLVIEKQSDALVKKYADAGYYPPTGSSSRGIAKHRHGVDGI